MKFESSLKPFTKINSKWIKALSIRPDSLKLTEENTRKKLMTLVLAMIFLDMTPTAQETKVKINNYDYIKLKSSSQ